MNKSFNFIIVYSVFLLFPLGLSGFNSLDNNSDEQNHFFINSFCQFSKNIQSQFATELNYKEEGAVAFEELKENAIVTIEEDFASGGYSGGNPEGIDGWLTDWSENNDDNNAGSGSIQVASQEVHFIGASGSPVRSIERQVDITGATSADLSFDWRSDASGLENSDNLKFSYSTNGGSTFTDLFDENGDYLESNTPSSASFNITGLSVNSLIIRFEFVASSTSEDIFVDNIQVQYDDNGIGGGLPTGNLTCSAGASEIVGTVFEDFNYDGDYDSGENLGLENIMVTATDSLGNSTTDNTDANGDFTLSGLAAGYTYRIEFTNIPSWASPTIYGGDNGTVVQFVQPGNCANLGLSSPSFFCQNNPTIALSCFQMGTGANNPTDPGFVSFPWSSSGNVNDGATAPTYGATFVDIGTVWGQAYQRYTEQAFVSTVLRRHSAVGPTGLGGIYVLSNTGALVGSFDLHGVVPANGGTALDFGAITRSVVSGGISAGTAGDNQISDDPTEATRDLDAFAKVGAVGYGDIDFEEDGHTLWVTNLNNRELIRVETQNTSNPLPTDGSQAAGAIVNRYDMTTLLGFPTCTGGLFRPWALAFYQGRGYLGGICSGETLQNTSDVEAYVLSFDPDNVAAGFTTELNFPMTYTRETPSSFRVPDLDGSWQPWANTNAEITYMTHSREFVNHGSPILTDIVFAKSGNMTLGFIDRESIQFGIQNYKPLSAQNDLVDVEAGGEILHACLITGGWVIENGTTCDGISDSGAGPNGSLTNDGPSGMGEYYYGDNYMHGSGSVDGHLEITHGGLVYSTADDQIISNAYDPINRQDGGDTNSQGVITFNSSGGDKVNGYQFSRILDLGKSGALGDMEAFCNPAPIEIGNFVWLDANIDGVQDAGESPLEGVRIELYDNNGDLVAFDTTNINGQYYFSSDATDNATWAVADDALNFGATYYIVAGGNGQFLNEILSLNGTDYSLTTANNVSGINADEIDSDGTIASGIDPDFDGEPYVQITTGNAGEVNHTYDFGFKLPCSILMDAAAVNCAGTESFTADWQVIIIYSGEPTGNLSYQRNGETVGSFTPNISPDTINISGIPADGGKSDTINIYFANDNTCGDTLTLVRPLPCPADVTACTSTSGCIGGNAFEDFNCNGTDDTNELGVQGIQVVIYDCMNTAVDTVWTDSEGDWQVCGLTDGEAYRIEHVLPESIACWATPTHAGSDNGTDIQFLTAPACTKFSLSSPSDYCQENPPLSVVCYLQPIDVTSTDWTDEAAIVQIPYESGTTDLTTASSATIQDEAFMNIIATNGEVGAVYGIATDNQNSIVYSTAFMKRHVPFGPSGPGAIYKLQNGTDTTFLDLNTLLSGNPAGTDTHSPNGNNYQQDDIWDEIGKTSFGDLIITPDGKYLYTVTLTDHDRKLYRIAIPSDGTHPLSSDIETFDLPSPADCPSHPSTGSGELNYNIRPGALQYEQGLIYVGLTCTAESTQNTDDLKGYVYVFEPTENSFSGPLLTVPFDYSRTDILVGSTPGDFYPWNPNQLTNSTSPPLNGSTNNMSYPMPWLMNIGFSDDGCMILGVTDRFGHLASGAHNPPQQVNGNAGGDILKACSLSGTWTLENNGNDGINPATGGAGTNAGPGNGEFFYQEAMNLAGSHHTETSNGGLAILPGNGEVVLGVYDPAPTTTSLPGPVSVFDSGGLIYLDTKDGSRTRSYMLFNRTEYGGDSGLGFDKVSATGGIVFNCEPAPLEIGNYVWCDSIANGIQDACESGINDMIVQLYDRNGNLIGQDTTVNGNYYFNQNNVDTTGITVDGSGVASPVTAWSGMSYSTQYFIVFGNGQYSGGEFTVGSETYFGITSMVNAGVNDNIDSDVDGNSLTAGSLGARPDGLPFIDMTTSATGCGDHKYDMGILCSQECELILNIVQSNCTNNGNGTFTASYDLIYTWQGAPSGENIEFYQNGVSIGNIDPSTGSSPDTLGISIDADGNGQDTLIVYFATTNTCADTLILKAPVPCPTDVATCTSSSGCIGGNAFEDFNCNGIDDTNEPGVRGVQIVIYDCDNMAIDTVWTDSEGDWQVCGLADGEAYRVEHILPESIACWAQPTHAGSDNGTDVQFLTAPACTKFSLSSPADYCQANPEILNICFPIGDPTINGSLSENIPVLINYEYASTGRNTAFKDIISVADTLGTTWGLAYSPKTKKIYTSAVLRRHSGFGELGSGGIYEIDATNLASPIIDMWMTIPDVGSSLTRDLSAVSLTSRDTEAYSQVGKMSLGDIDISEDGETLYVMNLHNNGTLLAIDIVSKTIIGTYPISNPGCSTSGDVRPWGIKVHKGQVFIGVVCSEESIGGSDADLMGFVMKLNTSTNSFETVIDIPLNYPRDEIVNVCPGVLQWYRWDSDPSNFDSRACFINGNNKTIAYPQPIISDIEFDDNGDMIIGLTDRMAMMGGADNFSPDTNDPETTLYAVISGGDILKICKNGESYIVEGNTGCAYNGGQNGLTEFYQGDAFSQGTAPVNYFHSEIALGALTTRKGSGEVISTTFDALNDDLSTGDYFAKQGVRWLSNTDGSMLDAYEVVGSSDFPVYGKAIGLGDLELFCDPAPLEIGNYVWCDSIENGIQDACERGIDSIIVQLYSATGVLVGQDTTTNSGQYYFNQYNVDTTGITVDGNGAATPVTAWSGMEYSTQYFIVFGNNQFATDGFTTVSGIYGITSMINVGSNDNIDSDVDGMSLTSGSLGTRPDGLPFIDLTTSATGCGDHKYDLGLTCPNYDYGDLPDIADGTTGINDYETYDSTGGPSHQIITGLFLGDTVDAEIDGFPNSLAVGDDNDGVDDEDGIAIFSSLDISPGGIIRLPLSVTNTTTDTAYLEAWIDWNGDGAFDGVNEMVADLKDNEDGVFPAYLEINVPSNAVSGSLLGFRIRLSNTDNMTPYGRVNSGEVEDYLIGIDCPQVICLPVEMTIIKE